jgi:hypothetical protein
MERDWAIIVGVKDYLDPGLNTLEGPVSDARSFYSWLTRPEGGNIPDLIQPDEDNPARIKFVKSAGRPSSPSQAKPTGDDVFAAGEDITSWLEAHRQTGRRLYIYMSGHGCTPISAEQAESVALLMANARTTGAMLNFPATACAKYMRRGGYFEEVILIMDCCRSRASNAISIPYYSIMGDTTREGALVEAYATSWDSQAHEFPYPPTNDKRGAFTRALIACLESGRLTGHQLKESVEFLVEKDLLSQGLSKEAAGKRQPVVRGDPDLTKIWFSEGARPARTQITIRREAGMPAPQIFRTAVFPNLLLQKEPGDSPDPWCWLLGPGEYGLTVGDTSRMFRVYVGSPEELLP